MAAPARAYSTTTTRTCMESNGKLIVARCAGLNSEIGRDEAQKAQKGD
jgi:hypothetical protein